jgi:hypothetical protein
VLLHQLDGVAVTPAAANAADLDAALDAAALAVLGLGR